MSQDLTRADLKDSEFAFIVEGVIDNDDIILIESSQQQDQLLNKGFGERHKEKYILENYEGLFLLYSKKLILKKKINNLIFPPFLKNS